MQTAEKRKLTYADYAQLPEGAPYQLIDGELVMSPAPTPYHQQILGRLFYAMTRFVRRHGPGDVIMAPIDVYLGELHTFQPDLLFLSQERLARIGEQRIEGAPDLVVEILSPSTAYYDLKAKARVYAGAGVREYWVVDPVEKSIEVYDNPRGHFDLIMRADGAGSVASNVLDGFTVALADVF